MSIKCRKISIHGKVQGVWFRASTKGKADELGLTGIVKNEKDGSVYVEACGAEAALNDFEQWCWEGSELAKVEEVMVEDIGKKGFFGFEVLR